MIECSFSTLHMIKILCKSKKLNVCIAFNQVPNFQKFVMVCNAFECIILLAHLTTVLENIFKNNKIKSKETLLK